MLISTGIPTEQDLGSIAPSPERLAAGPISVIECFQEIPCNPCVAACPRDAIRIEGDINGLPKLDGEKCNGCGICILKCPGLAIFVVDMSYSPDLALVKLPLEFTPLPKAGQYAAGLNRAGEELGWFQVEKVVSGGKTNMTHAVSLKVPQALAMEIRQIRVGEYREQPISQPIVCRCEDITLAEIRQCIAEGCRTIDEIKRRTRAGMGPCQGRTCQQLIARELAEAYGIPLEDVLLPTFRVPNVPISIEMMADACVADRMCPCE